MDMPVASQSRSRFSPSRDYLHHVRRDAPFHAFVAVYLLVGFATATAAGVPHKFAPLTYASMVVMGLLQPLALVLAGMGLWSLRSPTPLRAFRANLSTVLGGPHTMAGLLLFANLVVFMGVFTSLKTVLPDVNSFFADPYLADLDRLLHGQDPWLYAAALLPPRVTPVLEVLYFGVWSLLLMAPMLAVLLMPSLQAVRSQYLWTALIMWPLLGNLIAGAAMSGGPVFYGRIVGDDRFVDLVAHVLQHSNYQEWAQAYLWKFHISGEAGAGVAISAFPSMHLASATLLVLLASRVHRWLMWGAVAYCAVILFGSVYLGWHYAVDGYFSIAATTMIWKMVGWLRSKRLR